MFDAMLSITRKTSQSCRQFISIQMLSYIHLDIHHINLVSAKSELFTHSSDTITAHVQTQQAHSGLPVHVFNLHLAGALFQGTGQVSLYTLPQVMIIYTHIRSPILTYTQCHLSPQNHHHQLICIHMYIYIYISRVTMVNVGYHCGLFVIYHSLN